MKSFIKKHLSTLIMSAVLLLIIIFLIVISILKNNVAIAENWTRTFGRFYTTSIGKVVSELPFSLTETMFIIVVISSVVFLAWGFSLLGNKNYLGFVNRVLMISLIVVGTVTMYNASVGMGYHRKSLSIEKYDGEIDSTKFKEIATYFVNDYNHCSEELSFSNEGEIILPYSQKELVERLRNEFHKLDGDDYFSKYTPTAKPLMSSGIFTAASIVGLYFGVFGEINYNNYCTSAELPFTIAHEMCHAKGVMREDEAQLLTFYICVTSKDPLIRYSAYFHTIDRIMYIATKTDNPNDYEEVNALVSPQIKKNYSYFNKHWKGMTFLTDLGDKINNWYLQTFGEKGGTVDYQDTDTGTDSEGKVVYLSNYQSIYFRIYYEENS